MDFERLTRQERYDALTEIADMYYNQGKTQAEIANHMTFSFPDPLHPSA